MLSRQQRGWWWWIQFGLCTWTTQGFWPPTDTFHRGYSIYVWRNTWDLKQTFCLAALSVRLLSCGCLGRTVTFSRLLGEKKNRKRKKKKDAIIGALIEDQSHLTSSWSNGRTLQHQLVYWSYFAKHKKYKQKILGEELQRATSVVRFLLR